MISELKTHLQNNIGTTKNGPVLAYSLDDEISLGSFNTPSEVDASPGTIAAFRNWLSQKYGEIAILNQAWGTDIVSFSEAEPISFEDVRQQHNRPPFSQWRLARWMDWRAFMDAHFAGVLGKLTRYANTLDPDVPTGFVGAQQPSAFGGYDYEKLARQIQFIEAYDIGVTNEILRSFWQWPEKRPRVQTWFSNGDAQLDRWFHWYYLLHGNRGAIAWPDAGGKGPWFGEKGPAPFLVENAEAFREVQGEISRKILDREARFETDGIAIFYSMPSVRASWVTDVIPHGKTWPNRSSSLDNQAQSAGKNRVAWCKLLEDCGYQYDFVSNSSVASGRLLDRGYRVLVLNRALCLSDEEAKAIKRFAEAGGTVISDHFCGVLDENGNGRIHGALDDLFGREERVNESYFGKDGQLCELNGEKYQKPYLERLDYDGCLFHNGIVIPERTRDPIRIREVGRGRSIDLNLSPLAYFPNSQRSSGYGQSWRKIITPILEAAVGPPAITVTATVDEEAFPLVEVIRWNLTNKRQLVGVIFNPTRQGSIDSIGEVAAEIPERLEVTMAHSGGWKNPVDLRTGKSLPPGGSLKREMSPYEPILIEHDRY
ncbi:beta-galactosidase [Allorhodopirellula solitaria]|uniref:beta-galactosidase n=1 Tax=Allorhodopirellula solitaria TaxID=2527987 RepID=UPI0016469135|nr:beta-galactosidase [Allorhodopirellula solitaria]